MPLCSQYNLVTCAEPTWKAFTFAAKPSLNRILEAFEASKFDRNTKYSFVNFIIQVDGYSPGKEDTVFHDLPDIYYNERRVQKGTSLFVSLKIKREDWIDLEDSDRLEHLFFCKLFVACVHVCRRLRLNYRGLRNLLETQLAESDMHRIRFELQNLDSLTYNKDTAEQKNEVEVQFVLTETTSYYANPQQSWRLEDTIDECLQARGLGYVEGHEVDDNTFTVFCSCYSDPNEVLEVIKLLPMNEWRSVHATVISSNEFRQVQIK